MAGISDEALKTQYAENKIRFQKQELQNKEFSDGSGLEMYEFKYRMDDPQTGRFWSIDPLSDKYVYNSTYAFSENKVTSHLELEGLEASPLNFFVAAVKSEMQASANKIDRILTIHGSDDDVKSTEKKGNNIEVKKSVETSNTKNVNFGLGDFIQNLISTNSTANGPSLKMEVKETFDVKDKTTTTTKVGGLTYTGVSALSRITGIREEGVTVSGPVKLGVIPNATLGLGFSTDSKGLSTFSVGLSSSETIGNSTFSGGVEASISGQNNGSKGTSEGVSIYGEHTSGSHTKRLAVKLQF